MKQNNLFEKQKAKKFSRTTFIIGYVFSIVTILAAILTTIYWVDNNRKNILNDSLFDRSYLLFVFALIGIIIYVLWAVAFSTLLIVKVRKIDATLAKQAKQLDLASAIINLIVAVVAIIWLMLASTAGDSISDVTYILFSVCFDIAVIITLGSTIFNTIQYKNVFAKVTK